MRYLPLILKNCWRNRRRSILTILSIAASLCLLGVLLAMYHLFYFGEATPEQALRLVTRNRISLANPMPVSYLDQIRQVEGVREVMIQQWFGGAYKDARDFNNFFPRFAAEPAKLFTLFPEFILQADQKEAFIKERTACIITRDLSKRLNIQMNDRITLVGDIFPVTMEFTVRGIYETPSDDGRMYFHYDYLKESLPVRYRDAVSSFTILAASADAVPRLTRLIDEGFRNSPVQTRTETERAFQLSFLAFLGNVKVFLLTLAGALTFTLLLVSGNTMAMSIRERIPEVGVLKTLGFTPGAILGIILGESLLISMIGGITGLGLATLLCMFVRGLQARFVNMGQLAVPPMVVLWIFLMAAFIGVASATIPAWSTSRRSIVESLRFTD